MRMDWKHIESVSGIYSITCLVNNKMYVGLAIDINARIVAHHALLVKNKHYNSHLQNSWNKHGENNFIFEELEQCEEEHLYSCENWWCNMLDLHNINRGYNLAYTGQGRPTRLTEGSIIKRTEKRKKIAKERGYWFNSNCIEKMRESRMGKPCHPNMVINSLKKRIRKTFQYTKTGELLHIYNSQKEATEITKVKSINQACKGKLTTSGGFVWRYEGDEFDKYKVLSEKPLPNNSRIILQYDKEGNFLKEYPSLRKAEKETGICEEVMRRQANGKMKTINGNVKYIWKWKTP